MNKKETNKKETQNQMQIAAAFIPREEWEETRNMIAEIAQTVKDNADGNSEILKSKDVCKMLKIGRATFDRLKEKGVLPVYRIGKAGNWYCKKSELMRIIHDGKLQDL